MGSYPFTFTSDHRPSHHTPSQRGALFPPHMPGATGYSDRSPSYCHPSQSGSRRSYMDGNTADAYGSVPMTSDPSFDILEWYPAYQSCQRYFLDHAQHEPGTQALCALINIRLPYQWLPVPISASTTSYAGEPNGQSQGGGFSNSTFQSRSTFASPLPNRSSSANGEQGAPASVSLIPYIRRLVVTGFDKPAILHGFFGDDYNHGVLPHLDCERRNYLFAAKHGGWRSCKRQYDQGSGCGTGGIGDETVPFMKPLDEAKVEELLAAEKAWSGWLAMEDWMVGPRAPSDNDGSQPSGSQPSLRRGRTREGNDGAVGAELVDGVDNGLPDGV